MYVKVCGITLLEDALAAIQAGADVLGFNCIPSSKRYLEAPAIREIVQALQARGAPVLSVAVVANLEPARARALQAELGVERLQLHGDETAEQLQQSGPAAFKALRIGGEADLAAARSFPGHPLLLDAKVQGQLGGTGHTLDWPLIEPLARARAVLLAGGLTAENVGQAVQLVQPWGVDVASGVERAGEPRRKDPDKLRRFVAAARAAASGEPRSPF